MNKASIAQKKAEGDVFKDFFKVVQKTKTAFINRYKEFGSFRDEEKFNSYKRGILSEGMGLTALMLLLVAFHDEKDAMSESDIDAIKDIAVESFDFIFTELQKSGFVVSPINVDGFFVQRNLGYIDTVTWCVSSTILMRYAVRNRILQFDSAMMDKINETLVISLKALLDAQREDGTWGYSTDATSARSLYFTYSASSSLADFFDYVLGEIKEVDENNEEHYGDYIDEELLGVFAKKYGYDAVDAANKARNKLQRWLVENALPLLPKVAKCDEMTPEEQDRLGMWKQLEIEISPAPNKASKYYQNLYYTFYLIDMMSTAAADEYFNNRYLSESAQDGDVIALIKHYADNHLLSDMDLEYFFDYDRQEDNYVLQRDVCNLDRLYHSMVERAIFTSRTQYMQAGMTGKRFWTNSQKSGLAIVWSHEKNTKLGLEAQEACARASLEDPSVAPLSLRANTVYAYYVTQTADIFIDRNFEDVREDMYNAEYASRQKEDCVDGLWDNVTYNLIVTERAIEAIVDYYDYLCKFAATDEEGAMESPRTATAVAPTREATDALQKALDGAIADYLRSDEGKALIREAAADCVPAMQAPVASQSVYATPEQLEELADIINQTVFVADDVADQNDNDKMILAILKLYRSIVGYAFKDELKSAKNATSEQEMSNINDKARGFLNGKRPFFAQLNDNLEPTFTMNNIFNKLLDIIKR